MVNINICVAKCNLQKTKTKFDTINDVQVIQLKLFTLNMNVSNGYDYISYGYNCVYPLSICTSSDHFGCLFRGKPHRIE